MISRWRVFCFSLLFFIGLIIAVPSFLSEQTRAKIPSWLPHKAVTLGLDLQGGVHLVLEVGIKDLLKEKYANISNSIKKELINHKIFYKNLENNADGLSLQLIAASNLEEASKIIKKAFQDEKITIASKQNGQIIIQILKSEQNQMTRHAVDKSIEIIRRRIDETGALEPIIQSQGEDRIILQIPGFDDPSRVRSLIGKTAKLTFQWIAVTNSSEPTISLPSDIKNEVIYNVERNILLTGEDILDARSSYDDKNNPSVSITFSGNGGRVFSQLTQNNIGRVLAIVLDSKVLSAATINSHIPDGRAVITGNFNLDEAQKLALMIRAGALPAQLTILEEKVVGPGLGYDSIMAGTKATLISVISVAVWMTAIYSFFGIFAVLGIACNLCFLFAALVLIGATLTLPGLAGIALTVGMSVDANVLINERIKDELRLGHRIRMAVDNGYAKAMRSIVDSNITTLIGAALLYLMGTGPVRGFAITLGVGILFSLFTATKLTRMLVYIWLDWWKPKKLMI